MVAEILINENVNNLNRTFDYNIPKEMEDLKIGSRVKIMFGRRKVDGFVLNIKDTSDFPKLKYILEIISNEELDKMRLDLAKYISVKYFAPLASCIKLVLNPGISKKSQLKKSLETVYFLNSNLKEKLSEFLKEKNTHIADNETSNKENLENKGIDNLDFKGLKAFLKKTLDINITEKHFLILKYFLEESLDIEYEKNILEYFDGEISKNILSTMVKNGVLGKNEIEVLQNMYKYDGKRKEKLKLNEEQKAAFDKIVSGIKENMFTEYLLFGVTGSGKTEVYMQIIEEAIKEEKTAIMLVPEIGLTPQMEKVFAERFGSNISIMHSRLSQRERFDEWENIKKGDKKIVIGTRSAIFAPLKNLGVIIIDEEHDFSYISGSTPRYDAKDVARFIAKKTGAVYVSGSATPLVSSMYDAKRGKRNLLTLTKRVSSLKMPEVEIVNMRNTKEMFSQNLIEKLEKNIELKKQSLIFLNRRGFSNLAICTKCGETKKCPNCSVNLTYHKRGNVFKCHYCGYTVLNTSLCYSCKKPMTYIGYGTQKVKEEIENIFKEKKKLGEVQRELETVIMDQDSVNMYGGHKEIIDEFINMKRDVLIGTQMIAKGHHFPDVNLVSVLLADNILNSENYDGAEKAFQTLVQVIGRAGREENGTALIQTYNPDNYIIELAKKNDYNAFYDLEIEMRKALNYPPFSDIITFQIFSDKEEIAEKTSYELLIKLKKYTNVLKKNLIKRYIDRLNKTDLQKEKKILLLEKYKKEIEKTEIYDVQPYRINKINNVYRYKIIMKAKYNIVVMQWIKDILNSIKLKNKTSINIIINETN